MTDDDLPPAGRRTHRGAARPADWDAWLRTLEVDHEAGDPGAVAEPGPEETAAATRVVLERLHGPAGAIGPARPWARRPPVAAPTCLPLLALLGLLVLAALAPSSPAAAVALFVVAPLALVTKWGAEAYLGGHELRRDGELLGERASEFLALRDRLDDLLAGLDGHTGPAPADLTAGLRAARDQLGATARRLRRGGDGARSFACRWRAEPVAACDRLAPHLVALDPRELARELRTIRERLGRLLPALAAPALAGRDADSARAGALSDEIDEIRRVVRLGEEPIVRECRRLRRSFDPLHRTAARKVVTTRLPGRIAPVCLAGLAGTNLSTFDPVARTRRRRTYLDAFDAPANHTVRGVGRATVLAVRGDLASAGAA